MRIIASQLGKSQLSGVNIPDAMTGQKHGIDASLCALQSIT